MIYDYNECQRILDSFNKTIFREVEPIGYSSLEKLPIRHFTLGNGDKHVVVAASQHSNEIITTTFVIELMKYLKNNYIYFEDLTVHFIPILNPEGYIVNTSAIRSKLSRESSKEQIIKLCFDYYKNYRYDNLKPDNKIKLHQEMFNDIDYSCISKNYKILRDSIQEILVNHPRGSIIDWASNGRGIDLNSNSRNKQVSTGEYNRQNVYNNIRLDIPSPIGYPGRNTDEFFCEEQEISSLRNLFMELNKNNSLVGFLNYHSIGGLIYQRPICDDLFLTTYNYLLSKYYQEFTFKNKERYSIITATEEKITSVNDTLRKDYLGNILIELSPMMGNPIGVFGDINNFSSTINNNTDSFIYTMNNISSIYNDSKEIATGSDSVDKIYTEVDNFYKVKRRKIEK